MFMEKFTSRKSKYLQVLLTLFVMLMFGQLTKGQDLIITGVMDGPLTGGTPKVLELYVINDIADLSDYGIGSANNGGGTDGEEYTFPADAYTAGDFIYVATESTQFNTWFGFNPDYTTSVMGINGDDAVELFYSSAVVDVFGDINVDGNGETWEYLDGWAYRNDESSITTTFDDTDWTYSGPNALDGESSNASATTPFPNGTYVHASGTPTITLTPSTDIDFGIVETGMESIPETYVVEGDNLSDDITITAPIDYEISFDNIDYATNPLTLAMGGGQVSSTVYVRFTPSTDGVIAGDITHTSTDATQQDLAVTGTGITVQGEPEFHPTDFVATANGSDQIDLTWTDAAGTPTADSYLILANTTGTFDAPEDTDDPAEDTDLSDGEAIVKVANDGTQTYGFTGLNYSTTYYFQIWSYTNAGDFIDFKDDGPTSNATTTEVKLPTSLDFEDDSFGNWTTYNSASTQDWDIWSGTGANSSGYYGVMNGFGEDVLSNDWLISPPFNMDNNYNEYISFYTATKYGDLNNEFTLEYSTDYDGTSDPTTATWTELAFTRPIDDNDTWTSSGDVDLTAITGTQVYFAFHYASNGADIGRWKVDEITIGGTDDITAPQVSSLTYEDATHLMVTFNEEVDQTTAETVTNYTFDGTAGLSGNPSAATLANGNEVTLTVDDMSGYADNSTIIVTVTNVEDVAGNVVDAANDEATYTFPDVTAPTVTITPSNGTSGVQINANITIGFDEAVQKADGNPVEDVDLANIIELKLDDDLGTDVAFTATINAGKDLITIDPTSDFASLQAYYVELKDMELEDATGNEIPETSATFTSADADAPIVTFDPANLDTDVATTSNITITFSEAVRKLDDSAVEDADLAGMLTFKETDAAGVDVAYTATINAGKTVITIDPTNDLDESQDYYVAITASLEDADDNAISASNITFTTADETAPIATFVPIDTDTDIEVDQVITITFDEAIRNIDDSEITDANVDDVVTLESVAKAAIDFDATISVSKQVITITPTADLDTATTYTVTLLANTVEDASDNAITTAQTATFNTVTPVIDVTYPVGGESLSAGDNVDITWTAEHVTNVKIELYLDYVPMYMTIAESVDATLETYNYDIPADAVTDAGYKVKITDVDYASVSDESGAFTVTDATAPTIVSTSPSDNGFASELNPDYTITFTEAVTIGTGNFTLFESDGTQVVAKDITTITTMSGDALTATIDLDQVLEFGMEYYIQVDAGAFEDLSGNDFAGIADQTTWNFSTAVYKDLFFSEYIEGTSNNRAFEIFNPTGSQVDLTDYVVMQGYNGGSPWAFRDGEFNDQYVLSLTGTLDHGDVFIVYNVDADASITGVGDLGCDYGVSPATGSRMGAFTGDDALGLFKVSADKNDTTLIDVIGMITGDPGSGWDVAGVADGTKDHTLVRKSTFKAGNTDWTSIAGTNADDSEWVVKDSDFVDSLGHHTMESILVESIAVISVNGETTIDTDKGTLQLEAQISPFTADNRTVEWTVDDANLAAVDATGLLQAFNDGTVTVTATATDGSDVFGTIDITLSNQTAVIPVTGVTVAGDAGATTITADGGTLQMVETITPTDATDKTVTWSVDDETIATIDASGLLTANGEGLNGDVVVTATANDGSGQAGSATITVSNQAKQMTTIADLRAETNYTDVVFELSNEVLVTNTIEDRNQKFIQDATAGITIDDNDEIITTTYNIGDGITGLMGTLSEYGNHLQFVPTKDPGTASSTENEIVPETITFEEYETNFEDYESMLVRFDNVMFPFTAEADSGFDANEYYPLSNGTDSIKFRTDFEDADYLVAPDSMIPAGNIGVVAIVKEYWDNKIVVARSVSDFIYYVETIVVNSADDATEITTDGATLQMSAEVYPDNATDQTVTWSVDDEELASIDETGLLTAIDNGVVTVTATANDISGVTGSKQITISGQTITLVDSIIVTGADDATSIDTDKGTLQMTATVYPADADFQEVTWSVENVTGAATIDATGLLTAVNNGTVLVKAAATDTSGVVGSLEITLTNQTDVILVDSIYVYAEDSATTIEVDAGTLQLYAIVLPETADNDAITWSVENGTGEATISETGLLTAIADGTVTAKATAQDGSQTVGSLEITISNQVVVILVETIVVTSEGGATSIDEMAGTLQMYASVLPADATDNTITWSVSSLTGDATISDEGLLTAVADGEVQVKATANDGSGVEGTMIIEITNQDDAVLEISLENSIAVYPNPTEGKFHISIASPTQDLTVQIVNLYGQVVYTNEIPSGTERATIDLTNNKAGIYIIKMSNASEYAIKRIILE